jgi:hypothetical protein
MASAGIVVQTARRATIVRVLTEAEIAMMAAVLAAHATVIVLAPMVHHAMTVRAASVAHPALPVLRREPEPTRHIRRDRLRKVPITLKTRPTKPFDLSR